MRLSKAGAKGRAGPERHLARRFHSLKNGDSNRSLAVDGRQPTRLKLRGVSSGRPPPPCCGSSAICLKPLLGPISCTQSASDLLLFCCFDCGLLTLMPFFIAISMPLAYRLVLDPPRRPPPFFSGERPQEGGKGNWKGKQSSKHQERPQGIRCYIKPEECAGEEFTAAAWLQVSGRRPTTATEC